MASNQLIEREILNEVSRSFRSDPDDVTVKMVRQRAEETLGLESGFLKSSTWRDKSKTIITDAYHTLQDGGELGPAADGSQDPSSSDEGEPKRKARTPLAQTAKKQRFSKSSEQKPAAQPESPPAATTSFDEATPDALDESELSVLEDEPPKRRKSKHAPKVRDKKAAKSKKPQAPDLSATETEVKTLQSQLVKCGIRKLWGKELKPFETDSEKISHLKEMLRDAGMTGRFSEEKARRLKEERELQNDLAEVKEGNERWGKGDESNGEEQETESGRPRRRVAKGLAQLDIFNDDESEDGDAG